MGRFWIFFLSHTAPGFQLWFYFHLYTSFPGVCSWGCPGGLGFAPVRARWVSGAPALGRRGSGSTSYSGELAARAAGNIVLRRVWWPVLANTLQYVAWRNPLTDKPGRPQSTRLQRVGHDQSDPTHIDTRLLCLLQLCPRESWAWSWCSCLACGDPGAKFARTWLPPP